MILSIKLPVQVVVITILCFLIFVMVSSLVYVNYEYCPVLFKNNTVHEKPCVKKYRNFVPKIQCGNSVEPGMHEGRCEQ